MDLDLLFSTPLFISKKLLRDKFRKFAGYLKGNVLDIGCGRKPYKKYLKCRKYIGMDKNEKLKPDIIGEATNIPLPDRAIDSMICTEVLEHLPEPDKALREIKRVLKEDGLLYITVPMSWSLHYEPNDYYRFTKYGIKYLLEKSDFEIIVLERVGGLFSLIGVRLIDGFFMKIVSKCLFFLSPSTRWKLSTIILVPLNIGFYLLGKLLDRINKEDAYDWMVLAKNKRKDIKE